MEAIREVLHLDSNKLQLSVPNEFAGTDVEVIVLPVQSSRGKGKRKLGAYQKRMQISEDFDNFLPELFWTGER